MPLLNAGLGVGHERANSGVAAKSAKRVANKYDAARVIGNRWREIFLETCITRFCLLVLFLGKEVLNRRDGAGQFLMKVSSVSLGLHRGKQNG